MSIKNLISRGAGVLLHPTSLYGNFGIGDFGDACFEFIDFLSAAKQKFWQILPLNPIDDSNSPYQSCSVFAGNDLLISPEILLKKKYIAESDFKNHPDFDLRKIDYQKVREFKSNLFLIAYKNFKKDKDAQTRFLDFNKKNKSWLEDYALFLALRKYFLKQRQNKNLRDKKFEQGVLKNYYDGAVWNTWPEEILMRDKKAIIKYQKKLADEINYYKYLQFEFFEQWMAVKKYANEKNIEIIGDLPIFTAYNSCDVWANKNLFKLDENNYYLPKFIAGVPPDDFAAEGQLWGNPVYDWEENKNQNYEWWVNRIKNIFQMVDIVRIDHFRGFESYWEVAFGAKNAINGRWVKGPGKTFFDFIKKKLGNLKIIAEDLGIITDDVRKLKNDCGFPGMRVLQFAFDYGNKNEHLPHNFCVNSIVYTGTHDNDTSSGWYKSASEETKDKFRRYMNVSGEDPAWDLIRLAYLSVASCAIIPIQDLMSLDSFDRMNVPGTASGNWKFRFTRDMLTDEIKNKLIYLCDLFNR